MSKVFDLVMGIFREPGLITELRERALPEDVSLVIHIAAGEAATIDHAVATTGEPLDGLVEASVFFLQQILFAPTADSYRVLGVAADAPQEQLRENYRWLMKWLHPDRNQDGWEAVYADRVNVAWQDLKTPDRRAEYDRKVGTTSPLLPMAVSGMRRFSPVAVAHGGPLLSGPAVRRLPGLVLGALVIGAISVVGLTYWAQTQTERELSELRQGRSQSPQQSTPVVADLGNQPGSAVALAPAETESTAPDGKVAEPVVASGQHEGARADSAVIAGVAAPAPMETPEMLPEPGLVPAEISTGMTSMPMPSSAPATPVVNAATVPAPTAAPPAEVVAIPNSVNPAISTASVAKASPAPANAQGDAAREAVAPSALSISLQSAAPAPAPAPAPSAKPIARESIVPLATATGVEAQPRIERTVPIQPALAPGDAEALVREFAAAYAAGDLARFDRLFSNRDRRATALVAMRSRFDSTEMRYLEIAQLRWHTEDQSARARATFRDTYVPRGERRAITESGVMEWVIRSDAGDIRIASVDRDAATP